MHQHITDKSFQAFFTDADDLRNTMISLLGDVSNQNVIEPCFGEGAFIKNLIGKPKNIDAIDIDENHFLSDLKIKNCNYFHADLSIILFSQIIVKCYSLIPSMMQLFATRLTV